MDVLKKICSWIVDHKKVFVICVCVLAVVVIITACSTFGDVKNAQFGLANTVTEVKE